MLIPYPYNVDNVFDDVCHSGSLLYDGVTGFSFDLTFSIIVPQLVGLFQASLPMLL